MIAFALFSLSLLFGLYFFALACDLLSRILNRLLALTCSLIFFLSASLLFLNSRTAFPESPPTLLAIFLGCLLYTSILFFRRKKGKKLSLLVKGGAFFLYLLLVTATLLFSFFTRFGTEEPIVKVLLKGAGRMEKVSWKNPQGPSQEQLLQTYQVAIESLDGRSLGQFTFFGDLVGIRAKVIRFHPLLQAIGFKNLAKVDLIHNGYANAQAYAYQPTVAYGIMGSSWHSWVWSMWEKAFWTGIKLPLFSCALWESSYFPLHDDQNTPIEGTFYLTVR